VLVEALEQPLSRDSVASWAECLATAGVASGAVGTVSDGLSLAERLGLAPLFSPGPGYLPQVRHPVSYSGFEATAHLPPPDLGAHTNQVLAWLAGPDDGPMPEFDSPTHLNRPEGR
jgi:formyl-CoA transferase